MLFVWLGLNVYSQIVKEKDLPLYLEAIYKKLNAQSILLIAFVMLFMLFQWAVEAVKWQMLLKDYVRLTLKKAMFMIFAGISFSIATPNRLGEFIGRIMYLPKDVRLQATGYTFVGNFAQLIATCAAGSAGLFLMQDEFILYADVRVTQLLNWLIFVAPFLTFICLFIYFRSGLFFSWFAQRKILGNWKENILQLSKLSRELLFQLLMLSFLRYGIFLAQYGLVFYLVGLDIDFFHISTGISIMLFCLSVLPTVSLVELGLRWQFSLLLFAPFTDNLFGLTMSVTLIWLLNMVIPAGVGAFLLFGYNLKYDRTG